MLIHVNEFLRIQGYEAEMESPGVLFQDNQSATKLEVNGDIVIEYLPTEDMISDLLTKPLQGELFYKFRKQIMKEV